MAPNSVRADNAWWPLICPVCDMLDQVLAEDSGTLRCPQGHAFDIAREGYVNLIPGGRRRPEALGDSKAMMRARRAFLEAGHYRALSEALNRKVARHLRTETPVIADLGCGEGYYLGALQRYLDGGGLAGRARCFGVDAAKIAARLAARRYPNARFVVGDVWERVLFAESRVDVLLNVFAPRNVIEFARVAAPGALLLVIIPGPGHLAGLRHEFGLLDIEPDKAQHVLEQFADDFELAGQEALACPLELDAVALEALIRMTPSARHLPDSAWARIRATSHIRAEGQFKLLTWIKKSNALV